MRKSQKILLAIAIMLGICVLFLIGCRAVSPNAATETEMDYYTYAEDLELIKVINSPDLTSEMLTSRNGKLIIEQAVGIVTDEKTGAGHLLEDPSYYISYRRVNGVQKGDIICTYFVYNPDSDYEDDILLRFDYIIDVLE